jgi:adenylate cyclase
MQNSDAAFADPTGRPALLWSSVTWLTMSVYSGKVCPFVEEIGFLRAALLMAPGLLLSAALRPALLARLVATRPIPAQSPAQLRLDLGLALLAGVVELVVALLLLGFPAESGVKVILGFLTFGLFFGVDLALRRERALIALAPREGVVRLGASLAQRFAASATLMLGLGVIDAMLVLGKDLAWLSELSDSDRFDAYSVVVLETAAVFGVLLLLALLVVRGWARTLTVRLASHESALSEVEAGQFDVRLPLAANDELGILAARTNRMIAGLAERERLRSVLDKVTNASAARRLLEGASGERMHLAVLMCDLRGFTTFSEERSPEAVVEALNRWFGRAVPIVHAHGGVVDKFIGDGMLAVFGLEGPEDAADRAVAAGRALIHAARALSDETGQSLRVGVGVHVGPVVAGTIGSADRLEFTVIGDTVNTAARLESMTKEVGVDLLISEAARRELSQYGGTLHAVGERAIRGRAQTLGVFAVAV